jgi:hypothetical protein
MFRAGRRFFSAASLALIVVAGLHTLGHFAPNADPALQRVEAEMDSFRLPLGMGMNPSLLDIFSSLSLTMTVTLVALGLQNLVVAASRDATARLIRGLTLVDLVAVGALVALYAFYRVPPPLVTLAVIEALFVLSLMLPPHASEGARD